MEKIRLDKFLSNQLNISRSEIRKQIKRGSASLNGKVVTDFGAAVFPQTDEVLFENEKVNYKKFIYILMNKPAGVLSASRDKSAKTVIDLIPENLKRKNLFTVGRLDKDTTGLLIITDDGAFAHNCITPGKNVKKVYLASLDGALDLSAAKEFENGIVLSDGYKCRPAMLQILKDNKARVTVTEGKYHQVKRMFKAVGINVTSLHRESVGKLELPLNLAPGECEELLDGREKLACL